MLKRALIFAIFTLNSCASMPKQTVDNIRDLSFIVEPTEAEQKSALKVTLGFIMPETGSVSILLPWKWASESDYYNDIQSLSSSPGTKLESSNEPYRRRLTASPHQKVEITYVLNAGVSHAQNPFRALINPQYFHVIGHNLFVLPDFEKDEDKQIKIDWRGFSPSAQFANSFGAQEKAQHFSARPSALRQAIYVGGEYRIRKEMVSESPVFSAIAGKWQFNEEHLAKRISRVVQTERDFWNDHHVPFFLITLTPNGMGCCASGGTGLHNSFATFAARDQKLDEKFTWLFFHELFHNWNGTRIPIGPPEELHYWFSEGFTNYYSRLLSLRSGETKLAQYLEDLNEVLYDYNFSPERNSNNEKIQKEFWTNKSISKLPYLRGDLVAVHWNHRLKQERGISLDNLMRDLLVSGEPISNAQWISKLESYGISNAKEELDRFIVNGETIVPDASSLGPCVKFEMKEFSSFEPSFDRDKTYEQKKITGLKKDSLIYRNGLREGQELLDREMSYPPFKPSKLKIRDSRGTRWIEYRPEGSAKRLMPHFSLDLKAYSKDPKRCLEWFD
jgi:predicted metalloprotease with PDZ domain